jgi:hypothetical protein
MKYYIETRATRFDDWERYNKPAVLGENEFTNKKAAIKEKNRLFRHQRAVNGLREVEGSREIHHASFRVVNEMGGIID